MSKPLHFSADGLPRHAAGLTIDHNDHKNLYQTAAEWAAHLGDLITWESPEAKAQAIEADDVWAIQWYPDTPVGFYFVAAPTLDEAFALAIKVGAE